MLEMKMEATENQDTSRGPDIRVTLITGTSKLGSPPRSSGILCARAKSGRGRPTTNNPA